MSVLSDILDTLDRWKDWKAMRMAPDRITALEKRVEELEAQLGDSSDGNCCEHCGSQKIQRTGSRPNAAMGAVGIRDFCFTCNDCGKESWIMMPPPD